MTPSLQHRVEYGAVMGVRAVLRVCPMPVVLAFGTVLGRLFHALDRPHRRLALSNLEAAFPTRPAAERADIAREMFSHFGRLLMVLLKFSTMSPEQMVSSQFTAAEMNARILAAQNAQQAQPNAIRQAGIFHTPPPPPPPSPEQPNQLARQLFFARMGGVRGKFSLKSGDFLTTHVDHDDKIHVFYCFSGNSGVTQEPIDMFPSDTLIAQFRMMLA